MTNLKDVKLHFTVTNVQFKGGINFTIKLLSAKIKGFPHKLH